MVEEEKVPKRDNDELRILSSILDVVGNNRYVAEVKSGVDLVHEVERCGLGKIVNEPSTAWQKKKQQTLYT